MNGVAIFELISGVIAAFFGGYEVIKLIMTRSSVKRAAKLANQKTEQEIEQQEDDNMISHWEKILAQHEKDIEYYRDLMKEKNEQIRVLEERIESREGTILTLRDEINDLSSENTGLKLIRCEKLQCSERIPPFGYSKIDIRNGQLIEEN